MALLLTGLLYLLCRSAAAEHLTSHATGAVYFAVRLGSWLCSAAQASGTAAEPLEGVQAEF